MRIKVGNRIKDHIRWNKMTVSGVARMLGIATQNLYWYMMGKTTPSDEHAEALARIFKVRKSDIFFVQDNQDITEPEYWAALDVAEKLMESDPAPDSSEGKQLSFLATIIKDYEARNWKKLKLIKTT